MLGLKNKGGGVFKICRIQGDIFGLQGLHFPGGEPLYLTLIVNFQKKLPQFSENNMVNIVK